MRLRVLAIALLFALQCSGREKKLREIEELIAAGSKEEALEKIRLELTEENKKHAKEIDDGDLNSLSASPGARTALWIKGENRLVVFRNGKRNELSMDGSIKNIQASAGGKFALVLSVRGQVCDLSVVNLLEREIVHTLQSCDGGAAVTPDGQEVLYSAQGGIGRIHLRDGEKTVEDVLLDKGSFQAKFPKLTNLFFIVPDPESRLYIFYGGGGFYRLYLFSTGQNVVLLKEGLARPHVYFPNPVPALLDLKADPGEKEPAGMAFTGGSGRYRLSYVFPDSVSEPVAAAPTIEQFQMLVSGWIFYLNGDTPALSHPRAGKRNLPLRARQAAVVYGEDPEDQGILYVDPEGLMVFRREPFTDWEKTLQKSADRISR